MLTADMTGRFPLGKKIYQLIISRLDGEKIPEASYQDNIVKLAEKGIGGFIIFGGRKEETRSFINKIQEVSEIPLFVASDIERGVGQQIQGTTQFPCQMAVSAAIDRSNPDDVRILKTFIKALADEAKDVGINMPLIPVLDVNRDPDNPIICTRAFSDDPECVSWFGSEYITELEGAGLISCAKHFPGHGDTSTDSHILMPVISKSYKDLLNADLVPFQEAIKAGASSIMIGHLSIPDIDTKPASLSKKMITDVLREELGFDGLVLTDALIMSALDNIDNVPLQCIEAGADILLHPADPDVTVKELISAAESKRIIEERIENAFKRIIRIKTGLHGAMKYDIDYRGNTSLSSQITDRSISLIKNTSGKLQVADYSKVHLIFAGDGELFRSSALSKYFTHISTIDDEIEFENRYPVFAIFTSVAAWKGSSGISESEKERIRQLIKKARRSMVISFGSPYVLRHFKEAHILIAAYEATEQAQEAVIKCLTGRMDFRGRIPVNLNL